MARYRYKGDAPADLPTLGLRVKPGDVVDVQEAIENPLFDREDQPQQQAQPAQGQQQGQQDK